MAHSVQSTAVDVFPLPPPFLTNSTVVPLSASSGSFALADPLMFSDSPFSDPPIPLQTHTRHLRLLELADDSGPSGDFCKIKNP
jgi:hypothetical protein